jgi:FAD-dependent oxidoreductase domain-containing protein 1
MREAAEVVVVGGGVIGSSIAVRLRQRLPLSRIVVVERDPTYARASSSLATGGIRQQYESPLNVAMAQYGIAFYRRFDELTSSFGHRSRAWFRQRGYLFLGDDGNAERLERRYEAQRASGARVERLSPREVADRFTGVATHDVRLGVFGAEDGYLDPREVLGGLRAMATTSGVEYLHGNVTAVERAGGRVCGVRVALPGSAGEREIASPVVVNAAGAYAAGVGAAAGLTLPIDPVRQHLFRLALEEPFQKRLPMLFDPDGTHWRIDDPISAIDAETLLIGRSRSDEPTGENFTCDRARLDDEMLPTLLRRHPEVRVREVVDGWAGLYEMTPDHNALLGEHPDLPGFVVAAGFSGHGLMMAPATGLAMAELIGDGRSRTFDVAPLGVDRFARGKPFLDGALV